MANNDEEAAAEAAKWAVSSDQFSTHFTYFHRVTPPDTLLKGERAREFFLQTRLPPHILSEIWKLADVDQDGCLNAAEFFAAMTLVQHSLTGSPLPPSLPSQLHTIVQKSVNPQLPVADEKHLLKCKNAFKAFQSNIGVGVLGGDAARYIFSKSSLSKNQLFHIWTLSDIDRDGHLNFLEFTIAMHLIFVAKIGYFLPIDLDPNTILPPSFYQVLGSVQAEANQLPEEENPAHVNTDPFSPPTTPIHPVNAQGKNPFSSDGFFKLPARRFREGTFDEFTGNPFVDLLKSSSSVENSSEEHYEQEEQEEMKECIDDLPSSQKHQLHLITSTNGHRTSSASSSEPSSRQEEISDQHDYYILESPLEEHHPAMNGRHHHHGVRGREGEGEVHKDEEEEDGRNQFQVEKTEQTESANPTIGAVPQHSDSHGSRNVLPSESVLPANQDTTSITLSVREDRGETTTCISSNDLAPSPTWYQEKDTPPLCGSTTPTRDQTTPTLGTATPTSSLSQEQIITQDNINGSGDLKEQQRGVQSSPTTTSSAGSSPGRGRKKRTGYREVTVSERTEPVLQVAKAVDVIGSRETTPTPDDAAEGNHITRELTPEVVAEELESLSRASRRFLQESQGRLEEQQRRNLPSTTPTSTTASEAVAASFGLEEYKAASVKGLSAAIEEMGVMMVASNGSEELDTRVEQAKLESEVNTQTASTVEDSEEGNIPADDVISQLEDLEAEIMAALMDEDYDFDTLEVEGPFLVAGGGGASQSEGMRGRERTPTPPHTQQESSLDKPKVRFTSPKSPYYHSGEGREWEEPAAVRGEDIEVVMRRARPEASKNGSQTAKRKSATVEEIMEDLDDILGEEMASFQEVFEQFQVKDKKAEERIRNEQAELQTMEAKAKEDMAGTALPEVESMEDVARKRTLESNTIQQQWEEEMKQLEAEGLKALEEREVDKERTVESDTTLKDLENELRSLIEHEEQAVKETQIEKELRVQREKEEEERKERERRERIEREGAQDDMTVEEWIQWMEEKKKQGMTPAQQEEYEKRKKAHVEREREREEKRKKEEEDKRERIRQMMLEDQKTYQKRSKEVQAARLESEELAAKNRLEQEQRSEEESKVRVEKGKKMREESKRWEVEMNTPKAKSALAARWEETVKARSDGKLSGRAEFKTTVMSKTALEREEQRMLRRMSNGTRLENTQTKQDYRKSLQ